MNQIVNMIMRILMRKMINSGINAGIGAASGMAQRRKQKNDQAAPEQMSEVDRKHAANLQAQAGHSKKMLKMGRRMTKL